MNIIKVGWGTLGLTLVVGLFLFFGPFQWDTEDSMDPLVVKERVLSGEFEALDKSLDALEQRYFSGDSGDLPLGRAYDAFSNTHPDFKARLDEWVQLHSGSHRPYLARAVHAIHLGFLERGTQSAADTTQDQIRAMNRHMDRGVSDLKAAIERRPEHPIPYALLIQIAKTRSGIDRIQQLAREGLEQDPASYSVRFQLLNALHPKWVNDPELRQEVIGETVDLAEKNPDLKPLTGISSYYRGDVAYVRGRAKQAVGHFDQALGADESRFFRRARAKANRQIGRYKEALADIDRALEPVPRDPDYLTEKGIILYQMGRHEEAVEVYDQALEVSPRNPEAAFGKAQALAKLARFEEAGTSFQRATHYWGNNPALYRWWGWARQKAGDTRGAIEHYRRGHDQDPEHSGLLFGLIRAEYKAQDCSVKGHMTKYLDLCRSAGNCSEKRVGWVEKTQQALERHGTCQ